jgi:hypothetical protein
MVGLEFSVHPNMDHTIMEIGGKGAPEIECYEGHPSEHYSCLRRLDLELPWDRLKSLGLSQLSVFGRLEQLIRVFVISLLEFFLVFHMELRVVFSKSLCAEGLRRRKSLSYFNQRRLAFFLASEHTVSTR